MNSYLKENIKLLRKRRKRSQEEVAKSLSITRSAYNSYENGVAEPGIGLLLRLSDFFQINLDKLVKIDLSILPESQISQLEKGLDLDLNGTRLRVLATTVSSNNEENVELVPLKAKAGYTTGFADPEFVRVLPSFNMPFLNANRKYRAFHISGDSMPPVVDGALVTGEYVLDWNTIKNGSPYVVVTKEDGIVFKVVYNHIYQDGSLLLCSTNAAYEPYTVKVSDVLEVWKFVNFINPKFMEPQSQDVDDIGPALRILQREVGMIKEKVKSIDDKL